ncbi:MAG: RNA-binding S4 domain-containing protein [Acidobacteria bacterium]|nr:RNA-binding S4 domain-containing protein [Acidobacteriota bacterium]
MTGVRMDKWLWAARFFKTRALASHACELSRVTSNGQRAKAAREVRVGDLLQVSNDAGDFTVEVLSLSEMRGPAAVAQTLYRETDESKQLRAVAAAARKEVPQYEGEWGGRPSKQDRRTLNKLRDRN